MPKSISKLLGSSSKNKKYQLNSFCLKYWVYFLSNEGHKSQLIHIN